MSSPKKFQQQSGALNLLFGLRQESHLAAWCLGCNQQISWNNIFSAQLHPQPGAGAVLQSKGLSGGSLTAGNTSLSSSKASCWKAVNLPAHLRPLPLETKLRSNSSAHQRPSPCSSLTSKASQETSSTFHILFKHFPFLLLSGSEDHPFMQ